VARRASALGLVLLVALVAGAGAAAQGDAQRGRSLFVAGCSSCHGMDARGVRGIGPSLHGVGARAADFYLSTGRMPFGDQTGEEPFRSDPAYPRSDLEDLVAYVASLGGPPVPTVHPETGKLSEGLHLFTEYCAGCHQVVAQGGVVTGAIPPDLDRATPTQIAEAVRIGPYVMPKFDEQMIDQAELESIVRYVQYTKAPDDRGGWAIGHIGPIPEGLVAWLVLLAGLVLVARMLGERSE
jgi:ubiquinol-cytochrome c reductase cytochrome c subunit